MLFCRYFLISINGVLPVLHLLAHSLRTRRSSDLARSLALARSHGMATVFTYSPEHPAFADVTADFAYARLMRARTGIETGYPAAELRQWAGRARQWAAGGDPDDLPRIEAALGKPAGKRDVFIYFISAAKERNPAAAMALLRELGA